MWGKGAKCESKPKRQTPVENCNSPFASFPLLSVFIFLGSPAISPFCSAAAVTKIQLKPLSLGGRGRGGGQGGQEGQDIGKTGIRTHPD